MGSPANRRRPMAALLVAGLLTGCGGLAWPPPGGVPHLAAPRPARPGPANAASFVNASSVVVGRGDTVYALSRRHQVAMRDIIAANGLTAPYHLRVGQRIALPRRGRHVVSRGETLYRIARAYGVDQYDLARVNGISAPYTIYAGQDLRLPVPGAASPAPAPAVAPAPTPPRETRVASASAHIVLPPARPAQPETRSSVPAPTPASTSAPIPEPPARAGRGFVWPVEGKVVSSFGTKDQGLRNDGINIAAERNTPVRAAENGVVAYVGNELRGYGNLVLIKHDGGWVTAYAHNETLLVTRGQAVRRGEVIAKVGSSGNVRTPQLHFELRRGKTPVDPGKHLT